MTQTLLNTPLKIVKLIVFLGNPGDMYAKNRHNAGMIFAEKLNYPFNFQKKFKGLFSTLTLEEIISSAGGDLSAYNNKNSVNAKIFFLLPQSYMNLSGQPVKECASFFKIQPEEILVVHDELDLELGQVSFKPGGGLGGHNGLRSIKECLGSADFWRLRIGIGRPNGKKNADDDISSWVLSNFTEQETDILDAVFSQCAPALLKAVCEGPVALLPEWNKKKIQNAA
jgi:PTH1 family peptidyl-tRNA hydrolase